MADQGQSSSGSKGSSSPHKMLWRHRDPESTSMYRFKTLVEKKYNVKLDGYEALRQWSLNNIAQFWEEVIDEQAPMFPRPAFFPGARLNFAENLLYPKSNPSEDSLAVIAATEETREHVTWKQLRGRVRECSAAMRALGVKEGDRIAGFVANHTNTLVALLSTASVGAIWTAVSPDTGVTAVLDRMRQIEPVVLFADKAVVYNGKIHQTHNKITEIVLGLPQLQAAVIFETVAEQPFDIRVIDVAKGKAFTFNDFVKTGSHDAEMQFAQLQPDHPVYILYSSGTTGKPKCIVHGAIGTLLQHKKEHMIHGDIALGDRVFYFTTTSWMMHHWLLSSLASGATLILYDGSPFRPLDAEGSGDMAMPRLIDELGITHFGTSAKYLSVLEQKNVTPRPTVSLKTLKAIYSTGSPLAPSTFEYVYRAFGPDINLGSITGGTDIISLFGAPSPLSPVYAGEIQVRGLGMAVEAWDYKGKNITDTGEPGDLVCVKPFPCQPVMFWGAEGEEKYKKSYFETFPGVWHHGDFVKFNPETGGMLMLGRSDGILKPSGVRFGSAEIYNILLMHYPEVEDALCIGRRRETDTDETVVLFVKMAERKSYSQDLAERIQGTVKAELSARHVPGIVDECPEIPLTTNGKK
ncbi:MAG: hypothetical protein LQ347_002390 [Umbilicaria vellea]|nr:MAG: hypothetical protein LQ347_002390 [Umbilicaria vellea]